MLLLSMTVDDEFEETDDDDAEEDSSLSSKALHNINTAVADRLSCVVFSLMEIKGEKQHRHGQNSFDLLFDLFENKNNERYHEKSALFFFVSKITRQNNSSVKKTVFVSMLLELVLISTSFFCVFVCNRKPNGSFLRSASTKKRARLAN